MTETVFHLEKMPPPRILWRRGPCGAVASLEIYAGDALLLDTAADAEPDAALSYLLHLAREFYRADPRHDTLPPDEAVIAAYWEHIA